MQPAGVSLPVRRVARQPRDPVGGVRRHVDLLAVGAHRDAVGAEQRVAVGAEAVGPAAPVAAAVAHAADRAQRAGVARARERHDGVRADAVVGARGGDVDVLVVGADRDAERVQQPARVAAAGDALVVATGQRRLLRDAPALPGELGEAGRRVLRERGGRKDQQPRHDHRHRPAHAVDPLTARRRNATPFTSDDEARVAGTRPPPMAPYPRRQCPAAPRSRSTPCSSSSGRAPGSRSRSGSRTLPRCSAPASGSRSPACCCSASPPRAGGRSAPTGCWR